ncbi:EAL domain-containing response regulator [Roseibium sediminicola]|uniref:EAL domain-containing response regulator n=1 Tax=Roseibium sediminicola TaxID=2933272 RepID=A0ABT0H044_9HYPH|nr:EAL domain-containing response regulator [Roseibium sp. CAU 1639]MCK7615049.1 EAL domain-containing response regulator [Roseibium sp. CAU 1639]
MQDMTVLIVDDDTFITNLTIRMLKKLGIEQVGSAVDGHAGLHAISARKPDIILCDLNMPGMDGLEFLRYLGEDRIESGIILVSGEDKRVLQTATQLAKAHHLNVLGSLQKPIKPEPLKVLLDRFDAQQSGSRRGSITLLTLDTVRNGLQNGCIDVFFQPKVTVPDRRLAGVEALVRWRAEDGRLIPPIAFLPVVEENGLIDELTAQVFQIAVSAAAGWVKDGLNIKVAVNFSVESLNRFDLVDFLIDTAREKGIDPDKLILEVTESRIMEEVTTPLEILTRLRIKGAGLAIDDFGTGASSMQQLKRIPFTELKIDRAFVAGAPTDDEARAMLESSIALAKKLDLSIVAEGVETQEEWDLIESLGVEIVQGYFIAKPMPADELLAWARANGDVTA